MEYIRVTKDNIDTEHICCALSNNKDIQVCSKKEWMKSCFDDGLVFIKSEKRGKCFIEYIPAESAWIPIKADDYMYIDCFWVSGALKGHGYSNDLLNQCIQDAKSQGKIGLCILSSKKKKPFLSDPKYLSKKGFRVADDSDCVLYYTNQCPFNAKYIPILEKIAQENNISFKTVHIHSKQQAQQAPTPCTTYALFYDGKWITNDQQNEKKFLKLIEEVKNS